MFLQTKNAETLISVKGKRSSLIVGTQPKHGLPCAMRPQPKIVQYQFESFRGCIESPSLVMLCSLQHLSPISHCSPTHPCQHGHDQHGNRGDYEHPNTMSGVVDLLDVHAEDRGGKTGGYKCECQNSNWKESAKLHPRHGVTDFEQLTSDRTSTLVDRQL